ncbi:hypothetical protein [Phyllobacterium chamaecytisi]|uniref:hypothetical protein n=1 Tax=Phyllobacterium chamaecytisi TaxID=2876082 RepID=UPI001CCE345D|nr:hypothetical protein [Phyllobacterium sp. KW56]MBZ9600731.1 hypothetical protein [Phyllobacterium sp. KW56]
MKDPRELAARALCRKAGNPENTKFEGKPMWTSYLDEVETVLAAVNYDELVASLAKKA